MRRSLRLDTTISFLPCCGSLLLSVPGKASGPGISLRIPPGCASWRSQLLQVPGQWPVTLLHRLEDPAPQPPYLLLMAPPVHTLPGVTIKHQGQALRSVHRGVQLALWLRHSRSLRLKGSPVHVSALSSPGSKRPGIRASYTRPSGRSSRFCGPAFLPPFGSPASASWTPCPATGFQPSLRSAYRTARAYPRMGCGPIAGFARSARMRPGPGRAPSIPRGRRCPLTAKPPRPSPAAFQRRSLSSRKSHQPGKLV